MSPVRSARPARLRRAAAPAYVLLSALLSLALATAAQGQAAPGAAIPPEAPAPAPEANAQLQDIVITATRHSEMLSKVPISVSAFTQESIDLKGIKDVSDVVRYTPGVAIDAEGTPPLPRDAAQYALLAEVELGCPAGDAIERFTPEGPLALLPLPATAADGPWGRMSMVWCMPAAAARARLALADPELLEQLARALGPRLGRPTAIGPRGIFPLLTHRLAQVCEHRVVHLGNAAQSLHPVAGQGFNLGIRDCACLVQCLAQAPLGAPGAPGANGDPLAALHRYAARRRLDRTLFPALTSALPHIFSSTLTPVVLARSAALLGMDLLPGLRRPFTRLLMYGAPR